MTSLTPRFPRPSLTGSTTSAPTPGGCRWARTTTPPPSPWRPCDGGGAISAVPPPWISCLMSTDPGHSPGRPHAKESGALPRAIRTVSGVNRVNRRVMVFHDTPGVGQRPSDYTGSGCLILRQDQLRLAGGPLRGSAQQSDPVPHRTLRSCSIDSFVTWWVAASMVSLRPGSCLLWITFRPIKVGSLRFGSLG